MLIRLVLILLLAGSVQSAEILIRAKAHWMETADTTGWTQEQLDEKHQATTKGSPIVVMPDGWKWGKKECAPDFIILKIPGLSPDKISRYLEELRDSTDFSKIIKRVRHKLPDGFVDSIMTKSSGVATITKTKLKNVIRRFRHDGSLE